MSQLSDYKSQRKTLYSNSKMTELPKSCIALEEHAAFAALGDYHPCYNLMYESFPGVRQRLGDYHEGRLADMDEGRVSFQIISQLSGIANWSAPERSRAANDELLEVIKKAPTRLGGFAAICMADPEEASRELERTVKLGLCGAMIDNHLPDMTHYDAEKFWPVFETAERLDVPIYFHPAPASDKVVLERYTGNFSKLSTLGLATGNWGWHEDEGLHILKLFAAGLFTRFPNLKIIIGHMGEMIPMMIDRIDQAPFFTGSGLGKFRDAWEQNIWVTTSSTFSVRTLDMLLKVTPLEHVLYSIDTPFIPSIRGWKFVEEIAASKLFSEEELKMFVHGNAKKLFKL